MNPIDDFDLFWLNKSAETFNQKKVEWNWLHIRSFNSKDDGLHFDHHSRIGIVTPAKHETAGCQLAVILQVWLSIALPHKLLQMLASCSVYLIRSEVKYCRPTTLSTSCFSTCMTCIWSSNPILLFQIKIQVLADVSIHNAWQCIATCVRGTLYAHFSDWKRDVSSAIVLWHALHSIMLTCAGMQVIFLTTPETSWQHRVVSA